MFNKLIWTLIGLLNIGMAAAQSVLVADMDSGEPLVHVSISDADTRKLTHTDENGEAEVSDYKGSASISFMMLGYATVDVSWSQLEENRFQVQLKPSTAFLDQVVVSASKWEQSSRDIPYKVVSLKSKDIAFQNPQTTADLLGITGKVFMQKSQQGGGSPLIRGFATNRLLYSIDGIRMNTAIFRSGNIQNVISLDAFSIDKAEILFGPGSVIYGSDAIGGVMSFQTLSPKFSPSDKTLFSGGSTARYSTINGEKTGHIHFGIGGQRWSTLTSVSYSDFGDLRMGSRGPDEYLKKLDVIRVGDTDVIVANEDSLVQSPSGYGQVNVLQKIRFKATDLLDVQYAFHYSQTSEYSRYDRHIRYKNGLPRYGEWNYGPQKWMMHLLSLTHTGKGKFYDQMIARAAYQFFGESRMDRDIHKPIRHIRTEQVGAYSFNLDINKRISPSQKLTYGIEAVLNNVSSDGEDQNIILHTSAVGPSRYPQALWSSYAAFASYEHRVSEKVNLHAGARYNYFALEAQYDTTFYPFPFTTSSNRNGALTGSLGIVYHPHQNTTLMANVSTGFRSPNVDDSGKVFDAVDGFVTVPNPNLKPEYAYNAEIGVGHVFGDWLRVDLNAYYTRLDDALVKRSFTLGGRDSIFFNGVLSQVEAIQNAAKATVKGIQVGIDVKPIKGISLSSSYNIQDGEEELDNGMLSPSRHAAPNFGTTTLSYTKKRWTLACMAMYSDGKSFTELPAEEQNKFEIYAKGPDGKPYSPSWMIFSIKALYRLSKAWSLNAGMENITDLRYRPYSSGIVAPGRNFVFSAAFQF